MANNAHLPIVQFGQLMTTSLHSSVGAKQLQQLVQRQQQQQHNNITSLYQQNYIALYTGNIPREFGSPAPPVDSLAATPHWSILQQPTPPSRDTHRPQSMTILQCPPQPRTHAQTAPASTHTPEADSAVSDLSSMTSSSKAHEEGVQGHWDQPYSGSSRASTLSREDEDGYGLPINWQTGSLYWSHNPNEGSKCQGHHAYEEKDEDCVSNYKWDVYQLQDEQREFMSAPDLNASTESMDICSVVSNTGPDPGNDDAYDPEEPTPDADTGVSCSAVVDPGKGEGKAKARGLSESEMLCFLRLLEKREGTIQIRDTIEQFVTCMHLTTTGPVRSIGSLSASENEIFRRLLHLAPYANHRQVIGSMAVLPFVLRSLAESAIAISDRPANDRPRSRPNASRPRPRSESMSQHSHSHQRQRKDSSRSSELTRSPLRSSGHREQSRSFSISFHSSRFRMSLERGRNCFRKPLERRSTEPSGSGMKEFRRERSQRKRNESGRGLVPLPHLQTEEEESTATKETWNPEENKSDRQTLFKRSRLLSKRPSGFRSIDHNQISQKKLLPRSYPHPQNFPNFRGKSRDKGKITSLLDLTLSAPENPERIPGRTKPTSWRNRSTRKEPVTRQRPTHHPQGGLLPDPGTTAYRAVIRRAATSRLANSSTISQC